MINENGQLSDRHIAWYFSIAPDLHIHFLRSSDPRHPICAEIYKGEKLIDTIPFVYSPANLSGLDSLANDLKLKFTQDTW